MSNNQIVQSSDTKRTSLVGIFVKHENCKKNERIKRREVQKRNIVNDRNKERVDKCQRV